MRNTSITQNCIDNAYLCLRKFTLIPFISNNTEIWSRSEDGKLSFHGSLIDSETSEAESAEPIFLAGWRTFKDTKDDINIEQLTKQNIKLQLSGLGSAAPSPVPWCHCCHCHRGMEKEIDFWLRKEPKVLICRASVCPCSDRPWFYAQEHFKKGFP